VVGDCFVATGKALGRHEKHGTIRQPGDLPFVRNTSIWVWTIQAYSGLDFLLYPARETIEIEERMRKYVEMER
jgi:hypothetical protein